MMRSFRRLRSFPGFAARGAFCLCLAAVATPPGAAWAQADSAVGGPAWLPLPVEDLDRPEILDEPFAPELGFLIRADARDGALRQVRSMAEASSRGVRAGAALFLGARGRTEAATAWLRGERLGLEAGRLAPRGIAPLVAEELGLASRSGRVPAPGVRGAAFDAPASVSARALDGVAVGTLADRGRGIALWALAGRRVEDGARLEAMGTGFRGARHAWSATLARASERRVAGFAVEARTRDRRGIAALDLAGGPSGWAVIASVARSAGWLRAQGRLRWRSWELGQVASEIAGEAGSRRARFRIRLTGAPSGATGSSSRLELEGRLAPRGQGPLSIRVGSARTESFSNAVGVHEAVERYAVLEATVARAAGRTLTLLGSRRERETLAGRRRGTSLGGRLGLGWRDRGTLEIQLEGIRAEKDGAAWSSGLYAGGATALRTYARPGVLAQAEGRIRLGRWTLGLLVEERDDATGQRSTAGSIWIGRQLRLDSGRR